jgi:hypothetical protein
MLLASVMVLVWNKKNCPWQKKAIQGQSPWIAFKDYHLTDYKIRKPGIQPPSAVST